MTGLCLLPHSSRRADRYTFLLLCSNLITLAKYSLDLCKLLIFHSLYQLRLFLNSNMCVYAFVSSFLPFVFHHCKPFPIYICYIHASHIHPSFANTYRYIESRAIRYMVFTSNFLLHQHSLSVSSAPSYRSLDPVRFF